MRALALAAAAALSLLVPTIAAAAPPSEDFLSRWRAAEQRFQVLDLAAYNAQMSALVPEAVGFDVTEHGYFYVSAARAACLTGDPAYASLAQTGLAALEGASGKENDWLANVLGSYAAGRATITYADRDINPSIRPAQGWVGSVTSYFGGRDAYVKQADAIDLQSTDATDHDDHRRYREDTEDYGALEVGWCAGNHNQAHLALTDLPFRVAPRTSIDGQAYGLKPEGKVRVTWRPCKYGAIYYLAQCGKPGGLETVRRTVSVSGPAFSFKAPTAKGRYLLEVVPVGKYAGFHDRGDGSTMAMVTVKAGKTKLRRQFKAL